MKLKFSVITPFYNASKYINQYIDHHLRDINLCSQIEFIFIDDFSNDNSYNILLSSINLNNYKIIRNNRNMGPGNSRVIGAKEATGEYLMFVDIDDKVNLKEKITYQYEAIVSKSREWSFTQFSINGKNQLPDDFEITELKQILRYRFIALSSVMIKKSLFLVYSYWMCKYSFASEDYALWINLIIKRKWPAFVNNTTMIYNQSSTGLSANKLKQAINVFLIYHRILGIKKGLINFIFYVLNKI